MRTLIWLIILAFPIALFGQEIDSNRLTKWPSSYLDSVEISTERIVYISHVGDSLTFKMGIDSLLIEASNQLGSQGGVILLSEGNFKITRTFELNSNVYLIGSGSTKTKLWLDLSGAGHGILALGKLEKAIQDITDSVTLGSTQFKLPQHQLSQGDVVIVRVNDDTLTTSNWAKGTVGQITEIAETNDSLIVLKDPLRLELNALKQPTITRIQPVRNCGILNMCIERLDSTSDQTDNIHFEYTQNALVYGVESINCNFAHVNNVDAYKTFIYGSFFHYAFSYGSGGKAYGTVLSFTSSNCVFENNIYDSLRHSILFQAGPNGNVIGYNYSKNPYWTDVSLPSNFSGDIVFHGNYPFRNLVEGNICQNLVIDDSHGINGPNNVYMRNRAEYAGIFMNFAPASDSQIFIGNEITGVGTVRYQNLNFALGLYFIQGVGHLQFGNNKNGKIIPDSTTVDRNSFYLSSKPSFFKDAIWPSIGGLNKLNEGTIPAYIRSNDEVKTVEYPFNNPYRFEIISFDAIPIDAKVELDWVVSGTKTCNKFEIYRQTFPDTPELLVVKTCDTTVNRNEFQYLDYSFSEVFQDADSIGYFIVMHDFAGSKINSDTIVLINQQKLSVYFSPSGEWLGNDKNITSMQFYDLKGVLVCDVKKPMILPRQLPQGIYYVALFKENQLVGHRKIWLNNTHF